jgi:hypothetical protein
MSVKLTLGAEEAIEDAIIYGMRNAPAHTVRAISASVTAVLRYMTATEWADLEAYLLNPGAAPRPEAEAATTALLEWLRAERADAAARQAAASPLPSLPASFKP